MSLQQSERQASDRTASRRSQDSANASATKDKEAKVDQIIQHLYSKTAQVIVEGRLSHFDDLIAATRKASAPASRRGSVGQAPTGGSFSRKIDKWFNLEIEETDIFRDELKLWRSASNHLASLGSLPTMLVDVILDTSELSANQALVLHDPTGRRTRVDIKSHTSSPPTSRNIVLERWSLSLLPAPPAEPPELPGLYKQGIVTFRALYALLRTLPSYPLAKKLRSRTGGTGMGGLKVALRIASSTSGESSNEDLKTSKTGRRELDLDTPLNDDPASAHSEVFTFAPVHTPIGSLFLECKYRKQADFGVEDIEALLSSRFFDEDFFRPTVEARQGSLPLGAKPTSFGQPPRTELRRQPSQQSQREPEEEAEGAFVPKSARIDKGKAPEIPAMDLPARKPSLGGSHPFKATPPLAGSPSFRVASSPASTSPIPFPQQPDAFSTYYTGPSTSIQRLSSSPNFGPSSSLRYTSISRAQSYEPTSALSGSPSSRPQPIQRYSSARYARSHSSGGSSEVPGQSSPAWGPDSIGRRARLGSNMSLPKPPEDSDAINSFLAMIDSKPTLQRGENVAKSAILSRSQADERLRVFAGSVYREGEEMGQGQQQQRSTSYNSASESIRERMNRHSIEEERPTEEALAISPAQLPLPVSYAASPKSASASPNFGHLQPSSYPRYVQPQHRPLHVQSGFQTAASASTSPQAGQSSRMLPGLGNTRPTFPRYVSSRERRSASEQSQPTISPPLRESAAPSHRSPVFHDMDEGAIGRLDLSDEASAQAMFPDLDNNAATFAASRALPPSRDASTSRSRDRRGQARPQLPPYWAVRDKSREGKLGNSGSSDA